MTSFPSKIGKNSLNVMCWMMAMLIRRASWNNVSSSQCGLMWDNSVATRLCSRAIKVCMQVSTSCSLTRISPASKQNLGIETKLHYSSILTLRKLLTNMLLFGRVQPSSGKSSLSGSRSLRPYSAKTGFILSRPPKPVRSFLVNSSLTP